MISKKFVLAFPLSIADKKAYEARNRYFKNEKYFICNACGFDSLTIRAQSIPTDDDDRKRFSSDGFTIDKIEYCPVCGEYIEKDDDPWALDIDGFEDDYWSHELVDDLNETLLGDFLIDTGYQIDADVSFIINDDDLYHSTHYINQHSNKDNSRPIVRMYLRDANGNKLEFEDIGSGFAYSIPVLITASNSESLSFIQQPELHIHPALQSQFGDIFVSSLKKNKGYIIETHSEHLILRLLKLIRTKKYEFFNQDDLSVLYFQPNAINNSTSIKSIRITEDGDFLDKWPDGFFEERYKDIFDE